MVFMNHIINFYRKGQGTMNIEQIDKNTYLIDGVVYDYREDGVRDWIDSIKQDNIVKQNNLYQAKEEKRRIIVTPKQTKKGEVAMPTYKVALTEGEYTVLSTILDDKYSTFSNDNKTRRILLKEDYKKYKKEMIASTGSDDKKPMSTRTWERNFRNMINCGIIEEVKNASGKIYKYYIYNKNEVGKEYVLIESEIISQLKKVYKSQALKLYCIIRYCCYNKYTKTYDRKVVIDLEYMCNKLGLTNESRKNVSAVLEELQGANYIRRYTKKKMANNGEYQITYYEYEIVPFEEWKQARTPIEE